MIHSFLDMFLDIERRNQEILRQGKRTALWALGPLANLSFGLAGVLAVSLYVGEVLPVNYGVLIIIAGLTLYGVMLLIAGWWLWEFFRYDFDEPINKLYHEN